MAGIGRIVVIGLGYVGLPLAVALARKFEVLGFDIDEAGLRNAGGPPHARGRREASPVPACA